MSLHVRVINLLLFVSLVFFTADIWAACDVRVSSGAKAPQTFDEIGRLLHSRLACPQDVFTFRRLIQDSGLKLETTMVANRGYHNPAAGSFSMFEIVSGKSHLSGDEIKAGDYFFGHFTGVDGDRLIADQSPEKGSLMIEAFAWDNTKNRYNFYELRGDGSTGQWFYRGDSADIIADNQPLHRQSDPSSPQFGNRLRCSACHGNGGPIMKEINAPHNDWWSIERKLDFGGRQPDVTLREILFTLVPANRLSESVLSGMKKLSSHSSRAEASANISLQERLRPLFCPVELNLVSDNSPNEENRANIEIPAEFFVDSRLLGEDRKEVVTVSRANYLAALDAVGSYFPETPRRDADHAWLAPVKAESDKIAIDTLVREGIVDERFVAAVLSVDMTNPVTSDQRCKLLRFVPNHDSGDWQKQFNINLVTSGDVIAKSLANDLTDPVKSTSYYQQKALQFVRACQKKLTNSENIKAMYDLLVQRRGDIKRSEISKNPRGQILEPGFRIIFPETKKTSSRTGLYINQYCEVRGE